MVRDAITVRNYERKQLLEFLPDVIEYYENHESEEMQERASMLDDTLDVLEHELDDEEVEYDFGDDTWNVIVGGLDSLNDTRADWLRAKLARRCEMNAIRMGFTTDVPVGVLMTGTNPSRPESAE